MLLFVFFFLVSYSSYQLYIIEQKLHLELLKKTFCTFNSLSAQIELSQFEFARNEIFSNESSSLITPLNEINTININNSNEILIYKLNMTSSYSFLYFQSHRLMDNILINEIQQQSVNQQFCSVTCAIDYCTHKLVDNTIKHSQQSFHFTFVRDPINRFISGITEIESRFNLK